jgi:acetyltransferase
MKDVALAGAPLDEAEAKQLIAKTKAGVKMKAIAANRRCARGFRREGAGRPLQSMADAGNRIASIDVNPFLINSKVGVAVDGLIVLNNAAANKAAKR